MKKNWFMRIGAAALVVGVMSMSMIGGTLAKYTSEASETGQVTIAKWAVSFKEGTEGTEIGENAKFALKDTTINDAKLLTDGKIAPGCAGQFELKIDGTGSETAFDYEISLTPDSVNTLPIKFYSDAGKTTEITSSLKGQITVDADDKVVDQVIYWKWDESNTDAADTTIGKDATGAAVDAFTVTLKATQATAITPAP